MTLDHRSVPATDTYKRDLTKKKHHVGREHLRIVTCAPNCHLSDCQKKRPLGVQQPVSGTVPLKGQTCTLSTLKMYTLVL